MQETLDQSTQRQNKKDFGLYEYNQLSCPFKAETNGNNLIFGKKPTEMFLFVDKENKNDTKDVHYVCTSIFTADPKRDYTKQQVEMTVHSVVKFNRKTQEQEILLDTSEAKRIMEERSKPKPKEQNGNPAEEKKKPMIGENGRLEEMKKKADLYNAARKGKKPKPKNKNKGNDELS